MKNGIRLPDKNTKRWVVRKKAQVVMAIRSGELSIDEAMSRYSLSEEEISSWIRLLDAHGMRGLRSTRIQDYRTQAQW